MSGAVAAPDGIMLDDDDDDVAIFHVAADCTKSRLIQLHAQSVTAHSVCVRNHYNTIIVHHPSYHT